MGSFKQQRNIEDMNLLVIIGVIHETATIFYFNIHRAHERSTVEQQAAKLEQMSISFWGWAIVSEICDHTSLSSQR